MNIPLGMPQGIAQAIFRDASLDTEQDNAATDKMLCRFRTAVQKYLFPDQYKIYLHDKSFKEENPIYKKRTNWHDAAALQIILWDYVYLLEYLPEYSLLGSNAYRIDLLVIRKLQNIEIPHSIARFSGLGLVK